MELELRSDAKRKNLQKAVLSTIYAAGFISIALLAPNVAGALAKFGGNTKKNRNYSAKRSIDRLREKGLIAFDRSERGTFARITPLGEVALQRFCEGGALPKPKRWDGKWRIVIYDLKEHKRPVREKLRRTLGGFGFTKLQDSVWVYPYDCEDLIALVKADFKIGKEILYLIADKLENDRPLRKIFGVS
ncbi:MAG: CRISPR-associated endonuclease Cas2 [bacterium]|nr:CRISPR-associated endonuclease Cas2 [bacterium]